MSSATLVIAALTVLSADDQDGIKFFKDRIRPILRERCYSCHSEAAEQLESGLYLDSREGVRKGGDQGPAIEPGDPKKSLLLQAVRYEMDDLKMPPDRKLSAKEIADLEKWIKMGAPDPRDKPDSKPR